MILYSPGVPADQLVKAKKMESVGACIEVYSIDGDQMTALIQKPDRTTVKEMKITLGVETDIETVDGRPIKVS